MLYIVAVDSEGIGRRWFVGQRVTIHPACDWFMRGAKYATITKLGTIYAWCKLENIGPARLRAKIPYTLLTISPVDAAMERIANESN